MLTSGLETVTSQLLKAGTKRLIPAASSFQPITNLASSLLPSPSSSAFASLAFLRGGATEEVATIVVAEAFDLNRARIRLEGLSSYGVMSILLMSSALRLYTSVPKKMNNPSESKEAKIENAATIAFAFTSVVAIISGITTSIIFSLMGLYAKTALGMNKDAAYVEFFKATESVRRFGFISMVVSTLCMKASFSISFFLYFKGKTRYALTGLASALSLASWFAWSPIVSAAGKILY